MRASTGIIDYHLTAKPIPTPQVTKRRMQSMTLEDVIWMKPLMTSYANTVHARAPKKPMDGFPT